MNLPERLFNLAEQVQSPEHKKTLVEAINAVQTANQARSEWIRIPWGGRILRAKFEGLTMSRLHDGECAVVVLMEGRGLDSCPTSIVSADELTVAQGWLADIEAQLDGASSGDVDRDNDSPGDVA